MNWSNHSVKKLAKKNKKQNNNKNKKQQQQNNPHIIKCGIFYELDKKTINHHE